MEELISVSILTYNQEKYIRDTIRSVIEQDYQNLELVILDDCSTDNTVKRISEMRDELDERFVRVEIIENKKNTGNISKNCNVLLNEYRGKYFKILGGDDMLTPDSCRKSIEVARKRGYTCDVVFSDVYIVDEVIKYQDIPDYVQNCKILRNGDIGEKGQLARILTRNPFICIGALCKTESVREVGGYDERTIIEDYQMWIRMALCKKRFVVLHETLALYRRTPSSVSNISTSDNHRMKKEIGFTTQIFRTLALFQNECNKSDFSKAIIYNVIWAMMNQCALGRIDKTIINTMLVDSGLPFDAFDIWRKLIDKCRKWGEKHNNVLVYGYGKYGRFAVYIMDESGTKYVQIVDLCYEKMKESNHVICGLQEIDPDIDCALVTPIDYFDEISKSLLERGIHKTISFAQFLDEFVDEYVLDM